MIAYILKRTIKKINNGVILEFIKTKIKQTLWGKKDEEL